MDFFRKQLSEGVFSEQIYIIMNEGLSKDFLISSKWDEILSEIDTIILKIKKYQELNGIVQERFQNSIFEAEIDSFKSSSSD